jgi:hypothetical protein
VKKYLLFVLAAIVVVVLAAPALAQDMPDQQITVNNQLSLNSRVDVASVYSAQQGFVVIHTDGGSGPAIGQSPVAAGWTYNLRIPIDATQAASTVSAMLHVDDNELGVYEFGTVEGADAPVVIDGAPINPTFDLTLIAPRDQFVEMEQVTIPAVTSPVDGWLVIHAGDAQNFGAVLGQTQVTAGLNTDVVVDLATDGRTEILWPMLHEDTGEVGVYEFGSVEGADGPIVVNGSVATTPIWTVPHVRAVDQIVMHGDGMEMAAAPTVTVQSALCEAQCFVVIHQEADGSFGGVAGVSESLPAGLNTNLVIELDPAMVTARLWPMLHVDDGAVGTYEFGTVEGADAPVQAMGEVVTFPINAAPALVMQDQALQDGRLEITNAIMDAPGWIAIHSDNNGEPGPVLATALLHPGANWHVMIEVDPAAAGSRVFPMLHYDTGEVGVYEFGTVEGADNPTFVGGNVIVAPLGIQ